MGLFKKKESIKFRDKDTGEPLKEPIYEEEKRGEMVRVQRDPEEVKMKSGRELEQEYYKKHPEKFHPTIKKVGRGLSALDKKVVDYNKRSNIMNPRRTNRRPSMGFGFNPPGRNNANPFGSMFDSGLPRSQPRKKKSKTQYKVIGGKAYPIAGTGKSKTKKKGTQRRNSLYDPFDLNGW